MNKKKQPLELPTIVTYDRDELIMDNVVTGPANNSNQ